MGRTSWFWSEWASRFWICLEGGEPDKPRFSPVFYLADLMTGYSAAAGMMAALLRRSAEGGSYHVKLSLARSAMWVQELGFLDTSTSTSWGGKEKGRYSVEREKEAARKLAAHF